MHGLSLVLWEKRVNFRVQWTGTDTSIVLQWCEAKPASFPGWKPFQCLYRYHLHREIRASAPYKPEQNSDLAEDLKDFSSEHLQLIVYVQNIAVEHNRTACNYTHVS